MHIALNSVLNISPYDTGSRKWIKLLFILIYFLHFCLKTALTRQWRIDIYIYIYIRQNIFWGGLKVDGDVCPSFLISSSLNPVAFGKVVDYYTHGLRTNDVYIIWWIYLVWKYKIIQQTRTHTNMKFDQENGLETMFVFVARCPV